jgi:diphosphomevalonate decarboxylase
MREALSMHACMMDTWPPIIYLNEASKAVIKAVLDFNESQGETACGYTFDAGPNAHVYCLSKRVNEVSKILSEVEGVEDTIISGVGSGPRIASDESAHLLDSEGVLK